MDEKSVYNTARKLADDSARDDYLKAVCGEDIEALNRIRDLLAEKIDDSSFLQSPSSALEPTRQFDTDSLRIGEQMGPYKIREVIGEGGMGTVYVAEQEKPLRRKVALKVIKAGMDSKTVIARFEAERNALAMMNHPHIAKVLDAGTTQKACPFFAMELVNGIPITNYCDEHKLSIDQRLDLFVQVCSAIQHAHQKGIIHRDIKPTNVLVTELDGKPVSKVIDFGVAKALNQNLADRSIYTSFQSVIGTPLYMSPEQASLSAVDVDTRSDVYSLGVLLYELLTGTTPFEQNKLREAAQHEVLRIIREEDPPRPSNRISTLGNTATRISQLRQTQPDSLGRRIKGDLDWIVMTALAKDRSRRYDSASQFSDDIRHYLKGEVVVARPPSFGYLTGKFLSRHRSAFITCLLLVLMMVAATAISTGFGVWALREKAKAVTHLKSLADSSVREAIIAALSGDKRRAKIALEVAVNAGAAEGDILILKSVIAINEGDYTSALQFAKDAKEKPTKIQGDEKVGAMALMMTASYWSGEELASKELQSFLATKRPADPVEMLLLSQAIVGYQPYEAQRILNRSELAHTPVGFFISGQADLMIAVDKGSRIGVEQAMHKIETAKFLLRDSVAAAGWTALAYALGLEYARIDGRSDDFQELSGRAKLLINEIRDAREIQWIHWTLGKALGDEEAALAACKATIKQRHISFVAIECLMRHDYTEAERLFNRLVAEGDQQGRFARLARAHVVRGRDNGAAEVRKLVESLVDNQDRFVQRNAVATLCLACNKEQVEAFAEKALGPDATLPVSINDLWAEDACLHYLAGKIDSDILIETAGEHRYTLSNVHFTIAMKCLAERRRDDALEHLRLAVATETFGSSDFEWARGYLSKMEADHTWPNWLEERH